MADEHDRDGANITASRILNEHHEMVPESGFGDEIADNCALCGFAAGWLQVPGEERPGHATLCDSVVVREWIALYERTMT